MRSSARTASSNHPASPAVSVSYCRGFSAANVAAREGPHWIAPLRRPSPASPPPLEFGLISYDEDGRKLNGLDTHIDNTIPAARYAELACDGYQVVQSAAVPVTASSIRFAVRDIRGNRVGSLEVQLPPAKTAEDRR
jgi:hypothetical protein